MKVGEKVRIARLPERLVGGSDNDLGTRRLFELCIDRVFVTAGLENGLIELEVGEVVGEPAYMHSIWIEPECVMLV